MPEQQSDAMVNAGLLAGTDEHFKTGQALSADGGNTASPNREGITISSCGDDRRDAHLLTYADAT